MVDTVTVDRRFAICTFADEKKTTLKKVGDLPWDSVVALHSKHTIRPGKSGRMLGGYALNGTTFELGVAKALTRQAMLRFVYFSSMHRCSVRYASYYCCIYITL
jgi:hypothetical protein